MHWLYLRSFGRIQLTIRSRIWLLNCVAIAALAAIIVFSLFQTQLTQSSIEDIIQNSFPGVLLVTDMESTLHRLQADAAGMAIESDKNQLMKEQAHVDQAHKDVMLMLDKCSILLISDKQQGLLLELRDSLKGYFKALESLSKMAVTGNQEIAMAVLAGSVKPSLVEVQQVADTLRIEAERNQDAATLNLKMGMRHAAIRFIVVGILTSILLLNIGMILQRRILRPLCQMNATIQKITQDLDFTQRVPHQGNDELGRSIAAINQLLATLQECLTEMIAVIHKSIQATEIVREDANIVEGIAASGTIAATNIHVTAVNLAEHIRKIARHSMDAADIAQHSGLIATENAEIIRSGVAEIDGVEGIVKQAADRIFALVDACQKIGGVVENVQNITKQTKLLALNAHIEAARAGSLGRGFAIVAGEVKNLAVATEEAAQEIGRRVVDMEIISTESADAINRMIDHVNVSISATRPAGEAVAQIERETIKVLNVVAEISDAIKAGDQSGDEIIHLSNSITGLLQNAQSAAHRTTDSADHIQAIAQHLTGIIERFRIVPASDFRTLKN